MFKVGDKVKVVKNKDAEFGWVTEMDNLVGKEVIITDVLSSFIGVTEYRIEGSTLAWCDKTLKSIGEELPFKVGDKVRCIINDPGLYIKYGRIYTVKEVLTANTGTPIIKLKEINRVHSYTLDKFELVTNEKYPITFRAETANGMVDIMAKIPQTEIDKIISEVIKYV